MRDMFYLVIFHFKIWDQLLNGDQIGRPSIFVNTTGFEYYFNYLLTKMPANLGYFNNYVQLPQVRKAIHVGTMKWNSGDEVKYLILPHLSGIILTLANLNSYCNENMYFERSHHRKRHIPG